jgi:hypothetical protein
LQKSTDVKKRQNPSRVKKKREILDVAIKGFLKNGFKFRLELQIALLDMDMLRKVTRKLIIGPGEQLDLAEDSRLFLEELEASSE